MSCNEIQEKMSAWLDGELTAQENQRIAKHLKKCRLCQDFRQQILAVQKLSIRALSDDDQAETYWQDLTERIMSGVPASPSASGLGLAGWIRSRRVPLTRGFSLVGAVALLVLMARMAYFSDPIMKLLPINDSLTLKQAAPATDERAKLKERILDKKEIAGAVDKSDLKPNQQTGAELKLVQTSSRSRSAVNYPAAFADQEALPASVALEKSTPTLLEQASGISSTNSGASQAAAVVGGVQTGKTAEHISAASPAGASAMDCKEIPAGLNSAADKQLVVQTLIQAFESDDSASVKDAKADQTSPSMSAAQKNHLVIKTAELYFSLVVEKRVHSVQPQAIRFFQTHRKVLVDTLGAELYERRLTLINPKP